jgi:hypothetical protein
MERRKKQVFRFFAFGGQVSDDSFRDSAENKTHGLRSFGLAKGTRPQDDKIA